MTPRILLGMAALHMLGLGALRLPLTGGLDGDRAGMR